MRRPMVIMLTALVFLAAAGVGGTALAAVATVTRTKSVTIASGGCAGSKIFCFKPATLTVQRGTKVVWKNTTDTTHTVTRCTVAHCGVSGGTGTDPNFRSPMINPGRKFAFTFHHRGTYRYYCVVHGYATMHGVVTVR